MTHQDGPEPYSTGGQQGGPGAGPAQPAYGQTPYAPTGYGQAPYGQAPYGQVPYGQAPVPPQGGFPSPYGPPAGYPYAVQPRTNGMAIASLVLGILWIYWIGSILALVFGYIAKNQIKQRGESGGGLATAGIVLGWVGVGIFVIVTIGGFAAYS
jgi:hypothetical protein